MSTETAMHPPKKRGRPPEAKDKSERKRKFQKTSAKPCTSVFNSYKDCSGDIPAIGDPTEPRGSGKEQKMGVDGHLESCTRPARRETAIESSTHATIIDLEDDTSSVDAPAPVKESKRKKKQSTQLVEGKGEAIATPPEEYKHCACDCILDIAELSSGKLHLDSCLTKGGRGNMNPLDGTSGSGSASNSTTSKKRKKSTFKNGQAIANPSPLSTIVNLHDNDGDIDHPVSVIVDSGYHAPSHHRLGTKESLKSNFSQRASYDVKTIARDVLRAAGVHRTEPPLNSHVCKSFGKSGICPVGDSCHFLHARLRTRFHVT